MTLPHGLHHLTKLPVLVSVVGALIVVFAWFGGALELPGERMERHRRQSDSVHAALTAQQASAHSHDENMNSLIEGMVRGECLENPRENLARQGLLPTCQKLGIQP